MMKFVLFAPGLPRTTCLAGTRWRWTRARARTRDAATRTKDTRRHSTQLRLATQSLLERDITRLADRSKSWAASKPEERVAVAEACLEVLKRGALGRPAGCRPRRTSRPRRRRGRATCLARLVVSDWLETFIEARRAGVGNAPRLRERRARAARPLGAGRDGRGISGDHKTKGSPEAAEGTVSLVLGAGNRSFWLLIDVLKRSP